ncbi:MAG: hypothetical protein HC892_12890 [Saprospiraceae bacterium]|nr:hypothetical protein [Saprospiraceae bacterium]
MVNPHQQALQQIRDILLKEHQSELERLQHSIEDQEELSKRVKPIIEKQIEYFKQHFPNEFQSVIEGFIDKRISESQEQILNVIYPVLGKMIQKYVQLQFELFRESINQQIKKSSNSLGLFKKKPVVEKLISQLVQVKIEEIYVIQKGSGMLLGSASNRNLVNPVALAGMFTAIKLFVEDAFQQRTQNLDCIEYENYQICIQNFHNYYIAVAIDGRLSAQQEWQLRQELLTMGEQVNLILGKIDYTTNGKIK